MQMPIHTHGHLQASALLQQSPSVKGKRGFWFPLCKIDRKLSMQKHTWRVCASLELYRPFLSLNSQYLAKNSSKCNHEFPELWSYHFCIIRLTIPLKVFILPLIKLKSVCSLVQELTSLWCYILCNGVRPGKAFTAKPRGESNLQCLSPCLETKLPPTPQLYLHF